MYMVVHPVRQYTDSRGISNSIVDTHLLEQVVNQVQYNFTETDERLKKLESFLEFTQTQYPDVIEAYRVAAEAKKRMGV
jgi:hypothetical protein